MAIGDIGTVVDTLEFDISQALNPDVVRVKGNVFAVAYDRDTAGGWIATVQIADNGQIADTVIDAWRFENGLCRSPTIVEMEPGMFAIAYEGPDSDGWLKTVAIADDGTITHAYEDDHEFDAVKCVGPSVVKITDSVLAIAYTDTNDDGQLETLGVSGAGEISAVGSATFDAAEAYTPHIIHIAGQIYAIVYSDFTGNGWIRTVSIADDGSITDVAVDTLEYEPGLGISPRIVHVVGEIYAIAYFDNYDDGWISTVQITLAGSLVGGRKDYHEFDGFVGKYPDPITLAGQAIAIVYEGSSVFGIAVTHAISTAGLITDTPIDTYTYNAASTTRSRIIRVAGNMHAVFYTGPDGDGFIKTFTIERAPVGPGHLLMMGLG